MKRVIVMNFAEEAQAYQAFSEIKKIISSDFKGYDMAVVKHIDQGGHKFEIKDFIDFTGQKNTAAGSMIGMIVGVLGGPLGILLGWFAGSMIGASKDVKAATEAQSVFEFVIDKISVGQTGLLLIADEEDNRLLNNIVMNELGGEITRLDYSDVEEDIQSAQELEKDTKEHTQKKWAEKFK